MDNFSNNYNLNQSNNNIENNNYIQSNQSDNNTAQEKKGNNKYKLIIIVLIIIIFILSYLVFNSYFGSKKSNDDCNSSANNVNESSNSENLQSEFLMYIDDLFTITGRGTVITGKVLEGKVCVGDNIKIMGMNMETINTTIKDVESSRKVVDCSEKGNSVGLLLDNVSRNDLKVGMAAANSALESAFVVYKFDASIHVKSDVEGGGTIDFIEDYKPKFNIQTAGTLGTVTFADGIEKIIPGEDANITVKLDYGVVMNVGTSFSLRYDVKENENGVSDMILATGTVTKVYK